ncbi:hypothetical protein EJB05_11507, partial [Eragrostis curvula]
MAASPLARHQQAATLADLHAVVANDGVLPTDLLTEVLLRVPAKALCRFHLVCRSWRSLTSDPYFARAHSSRHPLFVCCSNTKDLEECEVHILDMFGRIVKRMRRLGELDIHLTTQADLVCVKKRVAWTERQDLLLNPATGEIHVLPDERMSNEVRTSYLGCVPSTGEYKVLCVVEYLVSIHSSPSSRRLHALLLLSSPHRLFLLSSPAAGSPVAAVNHAQPPSAAVVPH